MFFGQVMLGGLVSKMREKILCKMFGRSFQIIPNAKAALLFYGLCTFYYRALRFYCSSAVCQKKRGWGKKQFSTFGATAYNRLIPSFMFIMQLWISSLVHILYSNWILPPPPSFGCNILYQQSLNKNGANLVAFFPLKLVKYWFTVCST